ncbi:peptidoglycan-binding protein [Microbacterium enclense]|uniref:peptidoglycan-binding domain-containing protein n=1 Tax=Microbacterium enclense TaxID=993073 RepID=UPI0021A4AAC9|nr:peptidoglycan-binding domain-containing protein [Microbacterium enclense]MCT2085175.1 peptidoglycan-binding protein [Microbacterium enclense]
MTSAFADPRTLPLELDMAPSIELSSSASGRVTALACSESRALRSGDIAMRIDGQPVAALASEQPFYRDITWGVEGADVDALRAALGDLGYEVATSGRYSGELHDAVAVFQRDRGIAPADGSLLLSSILWIPNAQTVPSKCSLSLGQAYNGGDLFATVPGDLRSLRVVQNVDNVMVPGQRRVTVLGVEASLSEAGVIDDPQQVRDIQSAPTFAATLAAIDSTPLTARSALATPVQVVSLPPAALFDVTGSTACVEGLAGAMPVQIVGTGMGATLVQFPGGSAPSEVVLGSSLAGTGCTL